MKHYVTAVLTHHLNKNQCYLDLALKSLLAQEEVDLEIILVASCIEEPKVPEGVKVIRVPHTTFTTEAYSLGIASARPESTLFIISNDDVIVSKRTIQHMAEICEQPQGFAPIILNSFSNDGFGTMHCTEAGIQHPLRDEYLPMRSGVPFDMVVPYYEPILNYVPVSNVVTINQLNCFYFTMISRQVWETVGGLDREICGKQKSSHEDIDFCMRARKLGIGCIQTFGSFVWHFGGASVKHTMTHEDRVEGRKTYCEKWKIPYEQFSIPNPT